MTNIVEFPTGKNVDIPKELRRLADDLETSSHKAEHAIVILGNSQGGVFPKAYGKSLTVGWAAIMCEYAKLIFMGVKDA